MRDRGAASPGLVPIGELGGRRLAEGEPDLRGWPVVASTGDRIGTVAELLVDVSAGEVAALAVATAGADRASLARWADLPHVVLPLEHADIDMQRQAVVPDAIGRARLYTLERDAGSMTVDAGGRGAALRSAPAMGSAAPDAPLPSSVRAGARPANAEVTIEHTEDGEQVVRVPIVEERLVVQPVVTDVLVIRKRAVRDAQVVEADLRRERLDVHDSTRPGRDDAERRR
jgi:sporulation protein YlmC with PRC-barrel domain